MEAEPVSETTEEPAVTVEPTDTTAPTSTAEPVTESGRGEFAIPPNSCLDLPALLELPKSGFVVMPEDKIFECLGIESFQSLVNIDGTLPQRTGSVVAASTQRLDDAVLSAEAALTEDGVVTEELIRIDEEIWVRDDADQWQIGDLGLNYLFSERGELRLTMSGALFIMSVYGGGAEPMGEVELNGFTAMLWEADAANIASYFNGLGVAPVPVGLTEGYVHIWTTPEGLILKLDGEIRAEHITLADVPVNQIDSAALDLLGLPADALDVVPDYALSYELFEFNHDIQIAEPDVG